MCECVHRVIELKRAPVPLGSFPSGFICYLTKLEDFDVYVYFSADVETGCSGDETALNILSVSGEINVWGLVVWEKSLFS